MNSSCPRAVPAQRVAEFDRQPSDVGREAGCTRRREIVFAGRIERTFRAVADAPTINTPQHWTRAVSANFANTALRHLINPRGPIGALNAQELIELPGKSALAIGRNPSHHDRSSAECRFVWPEPLHSKLQELRSRRLAIDRRSRSNAEIEIQSHFQPASQGPPA